MESGPDSAAARSPRRRAIALAAVGLLFGLLHLAAQVGALLQSYLAGMAHFDEPLSRQAAFESRFWERAAAVVTFPLARIWDHLPAGIRTVSAVEWGLLTSNSLLWAVVLVAVVHRIVRWMEAERGGG